MRAERRKATGVRRVERWLVGLIMAIVAFVLEKAVMRSVKREGGPKPTTDAPPTTIRTKGQEAEVEKGH